MPRWQISTCSALDRQPALKVHRRPPTAVPCLHRLQRRDFNSQHASPLRLRRPPSTCDSVLLPSAHPAHPLSLQRCLARRVARHSVPHTPPQPSYRRHASPGAVGGRGCHRALRLQSYVSIRGTPYVPNYWWRVPIANRVFSFEKKSCSVY
jgi:hypothetical protein